MFKPPEYALADMHQLICNYWIVAGKAGIRAPNLHRPHAWRIAARPLHVSRPTGIAFQSPELPVFQV